MADVSVEVRSVWTPSLLPSVSSLSWLAGSHRGLLVTSMRVIAHPARHPAGLLSSLRAPQPAPVGPEPALTRLALDGRVAARPGA